MPRMLSAAVSAFIIIAVILGCSAATPTQSSVLSTDSGQALSPPSSPPKRITAAVMSDPPTISSHFISAGSGTIPGGDAIEDLVNAGLVLMTNRGELHAQLAEEVPSLENGRWRLFPDGRMETSWKIKSSAVWHDGAVFSAADLLFTARLGQDRELAIFRDSAYEVVESIESPDPQMIIVRWRQPFVQADSMFSRRFAFPRPRHLLERTYAENKEGLTQLPYWTDEYVGTGAFKLRQWVRGSHLVLAANGAYVFGRPKLDEVEVRFIPNSNALVANLLSGEVVLTLGRNLSLKQGVQIRDQWKEGTFAIGFKNWIALYPQLLNPNPALLLDVQFRRALIHALNRQELVDTLQEGMVPVAHAFLSPTEPFYAEVEPGIVRYAHDPARAAQLIESLGYARGGDGFYRGVAGQRITLEVRTSAEDDTHESGVFTVADQWKRAGLAAEPFLIPQAQRNDREYNATFPGIRFWRLPNDADDLRRYTSKDAPQPENRFSGGNRARYMNPAFDALIDRYVSTIPLADRTAILRDIVHHMTDQVIIIGLWYNTEPVFIGNRVINITVRDAGPTTEAWNAHEWDVR